MVGVTDGGNVVDYVEGCGEVYDVVQVQRCDVGTVESRLEVEAV